MDERHFRHCRFTNSWLRDDPAVINNNEFVFLNNQIDIWSIENQCGLDDTPGVKSISLNDFDLVWYQNHLGERVFIVQTLKTPLSSVILRIGKLGDLNNLIISETYQSIINLKKPIKIPCGPFFFDADHKILEHMLDNKMCFSGYDQDMGRLAMSIRSIYELTQFINIARDNNGSWFIAMFNDHLIEFEFRSQYRTTHFKFHN